MARIIDGNLRGLLGNVVLYSMNGEDYARSRPAKLKKKKGRGVNAQTSVFGKVSVNGTPMLKVLTSRLLFRFGLSSYNNGRGWMRNQYAANHKTPEWHLAARPNDMCQLNPASDLRDMIFTSIGLNDEGGGRILLSIPAFDPGRQMKKLPKETGSVTMKFIAVHSAFNERSAPRLETTQYSFPYNNEVVPAKEIIIETKGPAGNLVFVVMAIEPVSPGKNAGKEWLPAAIIGMGRLKPEV